MKKSRIFILMVLISVFIVAITNVVVNDFDKIISIVLSKWLYLIFYLILSIFIILINKFEILSSSMLFFVFYTFFIGIGPIILNAEGYISNFNAFTVIILALFMFLLGNLSLIWYRKKVKGTYKETNIASGSKLTH